MDKISNENFYQLMQSAVKPSLEALRDTQPSDEPNKGCCMCGYTGIVRLSLEPSGFFESLFNVAPCPYCNSNK